ncbi:MAG TPA: hypothetical protein PK175_09985, partial [Syntrophales bacterium]|nr:hypothetical protein [Syntrophales bacterium]
ESASAAEEMNAQAAQMKQISLELLGIIGGQGGAEQSLTSGPGAKPGRQKKLPWSAGLTGKITKKATGNAGAQSAMPKKLPEPAGEFKDF